MAENITVYPVIDSTNREAKERAIHDAVHGTVIIADSQTQGRGRYNRSFFSPPGSGLYMSFILFPDEIGFQNPTVITAYAAVRVCEAIEDACNIKPSIKWVNDIFLEGKKIGGILAEGITDSESKSIGRIILGIGINISAKSEDFPEEIRPRASSLYPDGNALISRNLLAAGIINRILMPDRPKEPEIFEQYRKRLCMLGSHITVVQGKEQFTAKALDIDEKGRLLVEMRSGEIRALLSGEVN